jgi:hypothetical protein
MVVGERPDPTDHVDTYNHPLRCAAMVVHAKSPNLPMAGPIHSDPNYFKHLPYGHGKKLADPYFRMKLSMYSLLNSIVVVYRDV